MTAKLIHTIPTWLGGKRSANPKFGGGDPKGGHDKIEDRLLVIQDLNASLKLHSSKPLLTSFHVLHELKSKHAKYSDLNNPHAIDFDTLVKGIKAGKYPCVNAITAPAFGFAGAEAKGILSSDRIACERSFDLHVEAIELSQTLKDEGLGLGNAIFWPAFEAERVHGLSPDLRVSSASIRNSEQWKQLVDFWLRVLEKTSGTMHLEFKPGDPGIDYICHLGLAIDFCSDINDQLGRKGMYLNHEWAHLLASGEAITNGMKRTIEAGLFSGFFHANSGQMLPVSLEEILNNEVHPLDIPIIMDWDLAVGEGAPAVIEDQRNAVKLLKSWEGDTIIAEHDLHHFGQADPTQYFLSSIKALDEMWAAC